jgi:hypothetical protein
MSKKVVAGNWKMNKNHKEGARLASEILDGIRGRDVGCEVILFQVLNDLEKEFPYKGLIEFEDIETGTTIDLESDACRDYFLKELNKYNAKLKHFCDTRKIAFETLTTSTPFEKALLAYFSKREELF